MSRKMLFAGILGGMLVMVGVVWDSLVAQAVTPLGRSDLQQVRGGENPPGPCYAPLSNYTCGWAPLGCLESQECTRVAGPPFYKCATFPNNVGWTQPEYNHYEDAEEGLLELTEEEELFCNECYYCGCAERSGKEMCENDEVRTYFDCYYPLPDFTFFNQLPTGGDCPEGS